MAANKKEIDIYKKYKNILYCIYKLQNNDRKQFKKHYFLKLEDRKTCFLECFRYNDGKTKIILVKFSEGSNILKIIYKKFLTNTGICI